MADTKLLAIYGNYLSDLDQTATLKKLDAELLKTSHSAASYRLFSSPETQAVLCEDATDGRQIRVELWQTDAETILNLLEQLSSEYHLANFKLSDGSTAFCFMAALSFCLEQNYEEASRFGGWERYLLKKAEQDN